MTAPTITLPLLVCHRCGHGDTCARCTHEERMPWIQRGKDKPRQCPSCHSAYWDRARKENVRK